LSDHQLDLCFDI